MEAEAVNTTFLYGEVEKKENPGLLYGLEIGGAQRAAYAYDALARQTKKILKLPNEKEYVTSYSYLPGAKEGLTTNLVSRVENGDVQLDYTYDALGNITAVFENGALKYSYEYDAMNRLVRENDTWESKTVCYTYDLGGNLLNKKTYFCKLGELSPWDNVLEEVTYAYTNPDWKDQLSAYNGEEITYDAMGNPFDYRGMILTWRKGRQLESLQKEDGSVLNFIYDCDGARVQKSEDSANGSTIKETRYYWNGDQLAALKDGEDLIQFTYDEKGIPFSMKIGEDVYYYLYNVQGDVVGLLDSNGVEVVSYRYSSWGKILETVDTSDNQIAARNPFRYRGYILDEETGMYYLKSRYYDPETGRFLNADSTEILYVEQGDINQFNIYVYCLNNPINKMDEQGAFSVSALFKGLKNVVTGLAAISVGVAVIACGVATPVMLGISAITVAAGGLTTANGVSDIGESVTGKNIIRDTIFHGNAKAYNVYSKVTRVTAEVGTAVCGGWIGKNMPRIKAYNNVQNYQYTKTASDAKHVQRVYYNSVLMQKQIIKYGRITKDPFGYVFSVTGTVNGKSKLWRLGINIKPANKKSRLN